MNRNDGLAEDRLSPDVDAAPEAPRRGPRSLRAVGGHNLRPTDFQMFDRIGVGPEMVKRAQIARHDDEAARAILGVQGKAGDLAGVEYPYVDPRTNRRVTSRIRLDRPPVKADGKPDGKYRNPFGDNRHLYFPPGSGPLLDNLSAPVIVVEAEKSALAITAAAERASRPVLAVACGGCWNWHGRIGKAEDSSGARVDVKGPLPDLSTITWAGRSTVVLFDARPNESVSAARRHLARELRHRGADVRHAHLPDDDLRVNGPDDLVEFQGDQALWRAIDAAAADEFVRTKAGAIAADDLDNIRLALRRMGVALRFNAFAREALVDGAPLDDVAFDRLWIRLIDAFQFRPSKETLRTVLIDEAHRAAFHPVRDYLAALSWDGTPRLNEWLITYGGAEPSDYVRTVGALPLIAAVRRVRRPGCKFDELLVLESSQGTLKSSALRALCPSDAWFSDDLPLGVDSKLVIERTTGKWIIEAAEMHGHRGKESNQLKAFLSRQVDGPVRLAYARFSTEIPRQFVMIGTTNASVAYLKDSTGARRFWPVRVRRFDVAGLEQDRDQLWAEAAIREAEGESIGLRSELWDAAAEQQELRRAADPWEDALDPLFDTDEDEISVNAVWAALKMEANHLDNRHADRVAAIMQRRGFPEKRRVRRGGGKPAWYWLRVPSCSDQRS